MHVVYALTVDIEALYVGGEAFPYDVNCKRHHKVKTFDIIILEEYINSKGELLQADLTRGQ